MDDILKSEVPKYLQQNDLFRLSSLNKSFRNITNKRLINLRVYDDFQIFLHLSYMNLKYNIYWDNKYSYTLNQFRDYHHQIKNLHIVSQNLTEIFKYKDLNIDTLIINITGEQIITSYICISNNCNIKNLYIFSTSSISLNIWNNHIENIYLDRIDHTIGGTKETHDKIIYL